MNSLYYHPDSTIIKDLKMASFEVPSSMTMCFSKEKILTTSKMICELNVTN